MGYSPWDHKESDMTGQRTFYPPKGVKLFGDRVVGRKTALAVAVRTEGVCHHFSLPLSSRRMKVSAQVPSNPKEGSGWEKRSQEGESWFTTHWLCDLGYSRCVILVSASVKWV